MSNFTYYLLWLAAGLAIIAGISAAITRQSKLRVMRRLKADELLDALARYSEWVAGQRGTSFFQDEPQDSPFQEICTIHQLWFPELSSAASGLFGVHERLTAHLSAQKKLRLKDPEAWLESDQDARFMALWQEHLGAARRLIGQLRLRVEVEEAVRRRATTSPA